jgi:hypothetical protein
MIEVLAPGFLYSLIKDGVNFVRGKRRRLGPPEIVALRLKWKPLFEAEIWKNHQKKLRVDVIIRDMKRIDSYPETSERKGISAWFRAGLVDTYHRGILVGLGWERLKKYFDGDQWTFACGTAEESDGVTLLRIGSIPYENIESVDWGGDGYYGFPHIYCFFSFKGEPYEHVGFYSETKSPDMPPFYAEVASYEGVRRLSKKLGVPRYP